MTHDEFANAVQETADYIRQWARDEADYKIAAALEKLAYIILEGRPR